MTPRTMLAVALCLAAPVASVSAQRRPTPPALTLTLDDAVARALVASNRVVEVRARGAAAAAVVGERRAPSLPQVVGIAGYTRTNHVDEFGLLLPNNQLKVIYPDIPDNYRGRLDVQWPIYTGGRLSALETAARQDQTAAARDVDAAAIDVRLDTTRAFWTLVVARESLRVVSESLARMTEHVRDARNQLDAGVIPPNDVLTAQAQEARQRMLSIQARAARDVAEADLARLVGAEPGAPIEPVAQLDAPSVQADVDALVAEGQQHRPDRAALQERVAAAQSRQRAADAGRKPTVAAVGGVDYARPNPRIFPRIGEWKESWDAGVTATWPLFDGGRSKSEAAEASAAVHAAQARLAEFDSLLALDIRQRVAEVESSQAAVDAAGASIQAAAEARRVLGDRFGAGVATSTDVVDAQVALLQAQLDRTQAIASARLAEARLNHALGR